jgi:LCP family protein required for cell wall assembly
VWGLVQFNRIDRVDVKLAQASAGQPQNFLIVGSDTRDIAHDDGPDAGGIYGNDAPAGKRADTIVVARIDPSKATIEILSVPRDLWVTVPGSTRKERINSAYNDGPQSVIDAIHQNLGLDINHYIEVDFNGFKGLVDAVGGVPMYFDRAVYDRNTGLDVKTKGCMTLNGVQALQFARARHLVYSDGTHWITDGTGDLGRITRQQIFLRHAMSRTGTLGLSDANTVRKLVGVAVDNVRIDNTLSTGDMLSLANRFSSFDSKNLVTHRLPADPGRSDGGADILELNADAARDVLDVFSGKKPSTAVGAAPVDGSASAPTTTAAPTPGSVTVDVLNGTSTPGLAKKMSERVAAGGFLVGTVGNGAPSGVTVIRYGAGAKGAADLLASKSTPTPSVVEDTTLGAGAVQLVVADESLKIARGTVVATSAPTSTPATATAADQQDIGMRIGDPPPGIKCG